MSQPMHQPVCVVVGIGPGNGEAFARKFTREGFRVALCSRNEARLKALAAKLPGSCAYAYDACDTEAAGPVFARIEAELGPVKVLVYNAGDGQFTSIDDTTADSFQAAWEVNARGLFAAAKAVLPSMRAAGGGDIVIVGATASWRGGAQAAPFASAKAAQRSLAQSMARHLGPERIHVSYLVIDGVIDIPSTRRAMPDHPDSFFMKPEAIAAAGFAITQQDPSAWTFEIDLRPFGEKW